MCSRNTETWVIQGSAMEIHKRVSFSYVDLEGFRDLKDRMGYIEAEEVDTECTVDNLLAVKSHLNELARQANECHVFIDGAIKTLEG